MNYNFKVHVFINYHIDVKYYSSETSSCLKQPRKSLGNGGFYAGTSSIIVTSQGTEGRCRSNCSSAWSDLDLADAIYVKLRRGTWFYGFWQIHTHIYIYNYIYMWVWRQQLCEIYSAYIYIYMSICVYIYIFIYMCVIRYLCIVFVFKQQTANWAPSSKGTCFNGTLWTSRGISCLFIGSLWKQTWPVISLGQLGDSRGEIFPRTQFTALPGS